MPIPLCRGFTLSTMSIIVHEHVYGPTTISDTLSRFVSRSFHARCMVLVLVIEKGARCFAVSLFPFRFVSHAGNVRNPTANGRPSTANRQRRATSLHALARHGDIGNVGNAGNAGNAGKMLVMLAKMLAMLFLNVSLPPCASTHAPLNRLLSFSLGQQQVVHDDLVNAGHACGDANSRFPFPFPAPTVASTLILSLSLHLPCLSSCFPSSFAPSLIPPGGRIPNPPFRRFATTSSDTILAANRSSTSRSLS